MTFEQRKKCEKFTIRCFLTYTPNINLLSTSWYFIFRFEEVRQRYERRESRQEDLNKISDLRQVIAEQEKDLACINEEKRYFQMRLMALEKHLEAQTEDDEEFEDAHVQPVKTPEDPPPGFENGFPSTQSFYPPPSGPICIPATIPECDDCDE